jgi:hypothetical protein
MLLCNGVPQLAIAACRCGTRLRPASQVLQSLDKWLTSPFGGESQLVYVELYRGAAISSTAEQLMELYSWLQSPHGVLTNAVTAAAAAKDYTAVRAILQVFEVGDTRQCDIADATGANLSNTAKQQLQQRGATAGTGTVSRAAVWVQQRMLGCLNMHDPTRSGFSSASAELLLTALSACLVASSGQYSQHAREAYMHSCTTTYKSGYKLIPNKAHLDELHALVSGSSSADAAITALVSANSAVVSTTTSSSSSSSSDSSSVSSSVAPLVMAEPNRAVLDSSFFKEEYAQQDISAFTAQMAQVKGSKHSVLQPAFISNLNGMFPSYSPITAPATATSYTGGNILMGLAMTLLVPYAGLRAWRHYRRTTGAEPGLKRISSTVHSSGSNLAVPPAVVAPVVAAVVGPLTPPAAAADPEAVRQRVRDSVVADDAATDSNKLERVVGVYDELYTEILHTVNQALVLVRTVDPARLSPVYVVGGLRNRVVELVEGAKRSTQILRAPTHLGSRRGAIAPTE